jgi:Family of unknown function (DUF6210)
MRIFLDPGHEDAYGLLLLVPATTGVVIEHQVNGHAVEQRETEGFLLPLAGEREAAKFHSWFETQFRGWSEPGDWDDAKYAELDGLLREIASYGEDDARSTLALDWEQKSDATEGWVPVMSALGPAILIFENSD